MNSKNVRLPNSQRQLSQNRAFHPLQESTQNHKTDSNLFESELYNTAANNFLTMFESEVKRHWGI